MTAALFLDNTVLCNFACIERIDLLEGLLRGRGRWTEAVAYEAERSSAKLPDLRRLLSRDWLGEPIEITDPLDVERVERIRRSVFGGSADKPLQHLGEVQSLYVILTVPAFSDARWVSDDATAVEYARERGVPTWETGQLMQDGVAMADISAARAFELLCAMADHGQGLTLPRDVTELE